MTMAPASRQQMVLAIRLGALGDMVVAMRAFRAIRAHHSADQVLLLTTAPFEGLARSTGLFDDVVLMDKGAGIGGWWRLIRDLRARGPDRVYDLQQNDRTAILFRALRFGRPGLVWNGTARGCSHPVDNQAPHRLNAHAYERHEDQLRVAGIDSFPGIDLDFLTGRGPDDFGLPRPYALLVPGASPDRPDKRWPAEHYGQLAKAVADAGITPVGIGGPAEAEALGKIAAACPDLVDLGGRTRIQDLAGLARSAAFAVGNDTGPMHVIAPAGCPSLVLYSRASDPVRTAPRGPDFRSVSVEQAEDLRQLSPERVVGRLSTLRYFP